MKHTITLILILFCNAQATSQSPFVLDTNAIDITLGNHGYSHGYKVVEATNIDSFVNHLVWEVGTLPEGTQVEIIDGLTHYSTDLITTCGNAISDFATIQPNQKSPVGIYKIYIDSIENYTFPSQFQVYLIDYNDCNIRLDSFDVNLYQAQEEDYNVSFNKEEIDIYLDINSGMIQSPHEELLFINSSPYYLDLKWEINNFSLPSEILFLLEFNTFWYEHHELGQISNCESFDSKTIFEPTQNGRRVEFEEIDATALEDWSEFPFQFTLNIMLPGCETVLDSVVVNLLNGTTATEDFEQANISIYPNPASNTLFIDSDINIAKIKITDIKGQLQFETSDNRIHISDLESGVYIASIIDQQGKGTNRKFIVGYTSR